MFFFITSLKHPLVTKSPALVYKLLDRTLSTINAQTNKNFRVIIVCHEIPKLSVQYDFIDYVIVDFPPPAKNFSDLVCGKSCDADFRENRHKIARIDKGRKYLHGIYYVRSLNPSHIMFFDADDCLSPKIVQTVLSGPKLQSWVVSDGYIYCEGSRWIKKRHNFNDICGTCYIFSISIFNDLPENEVDVPVSWYSDNLGGHKKVHKWLASIGVKLAKIPYSAVVYVINHGENHAGLYSYNMLLFQPINTIIGCVKFLLHLSRFRFLTNNLKKEFNLFSVI